MRTAGMSTPAITVAAVGVVISAAIAYLALAPDKTLFAPHVPGKNNTVLFLVNSNHGYSNVHLATAHAMIEKDPTVAIHFGTFDKMQDRVARINTVARARDPASHPVAFHLLPSIDYLDALNARDIMTLDNMITPPGLAGNKHFSGNFRWIFSPWTDEDHLAIYKRCAELIDEIDPSLVVLDPMFRPAMEAVQDLNRMYAVVSPNTLEVFIMEQKWGKMFWKYPSIASGFDYPLKWSQIPANIFAHARLAYNVLTVPGGAASRAFLRKNGIKNPLDFIHSHRIDRPWICQAVLEAAVPLDYIPPNVHPVGPMILSLAPAEQQDAELTAWVKQKPTVLINLGSVFVYDEGRAKAMASAIANVLSQVDIQVIWKFKKLHTYGDDFKGPLQSFIDTGRVKLIDWLAVDPAALLETGDIMALVHHGGSNCYHEAVSAGIPHIILPLWVDLYDFAIYSEYYGIGVWGCKKTAPEWTEDGLTEAFLRVVSDRQEAVDRRQKARVLGEKTRATSGRDTAAQMVLDLAKTGYQDEVVAPSDNHV